MHEALTVLLEKAEMAIAASVDLAEPGTLDEVSKTVARGRLRFDYPEDILVVALAGGTGSGKSSLFNALTGSETAPVGEVRPTTSRPLAAVPTRQARAMDGYLDHLEVDHRVESTDPAMCLIDLPDTDSVEVSHRHRVEEIMPGIDVLVWVVDPEKYRDAALHHRYLRPLAGYHSQFVFVLNQVDRLDPGSLREVAADLRTALEEDGIADPSLVTTSLASGGPPTGVEDLSQLLHDLADRRSGLYGKLLADLGQVASRVSDLVGRPLGYEERAGMVEEEAARSLGWDDRQRVVTVITEFVEGLAGEAGGQVAPRLREVVVMLPGWVEAAAAALPQSRPPGRRLWLKTTTPLPGQRAAGAAAAASRLLEPVHEIMAERARAIAVAADLALGVQQLRQATPG